VFSEWRISDLQKFAPAAIAGTFSQLMNVAEAVARVTHAVIPLAWDPSELLSAEDRELLWSSFAVPVFEQYLGPDNVLLASECQAHCSLHVTPAYVGPVALGQCACGSAVPRLPQEWCAVGRSAAAKREYALAG
jgi:hypothetical protein